MRILSCFFIALIMNGCASLDPDPQKYSYPPGYQHLVVDPKSICEKCNYENDLTACNSIAKLNTNYTGNAAGGAAIGAATGAIFGAILGLDVGTLAAAGAAGGGLGGLGNEVMLVRQSVISCMRGRGYSVLR